jgi:hypothetical protein
MPRLKGPTHPPGHDRPIDIARREFKQEVDGLLREFMKGDDAPRLNEHLLWAKDNPGPTAGRSAFTMFVNFLMKKKDL